MKVRLTCRDGFAFNVPWTIKYLKPMMAGSNKAILLQMLLYYSKQGYLVSFNGDKNDKATPAS